MENIYDVIVIGGSANGSQAARSVASNGLTTLIIEEHPTTGIPEHCSGLFSYHGLEKIDAFPPNNIIFNHNIYGSRLIAPNGKTLVVRKSKRHAIVCNRAEFDKFLLQLAINTGAEVLQPFKATKVKRHVGHVEVQIESRSGESHQLKCKILINAEGVKGTIAKQLGLQPPPKRQIVYAAQFYMKDLNGIDQTLVEVYQSQKYARKFFAWIIPMDDTSAKVGIGTIQHNASKQLHWMINEHPILKKRCYKAEITRKIGGRIPPTGPVNLTYTDNALLVGDVAGQTKPTTGGGVILGGVAAKIAGKVATEAIENNTLTRKFLKKYQTAWKREIYRNLFLQRKVRNYLNLLGDKEVNNFFEILDRKGLLPMIENYGHVDNQAKLAMKLGRTLSLYPFYLKTSKSLVNAFLKK